MQPSQRPKLKPNPSPNHVPERRLLEQNEEQQGSEELERNGVRRAGWFPYLSHSLWFGCCCCCCCCCLTHRIRRRYDDFYDSSDDEIYERIRNSSSTRGAGAPFESWTNPDNSEEEKPKPTSGRRVCFPPFPIALLLSFTFTSLLYFTPLLHSFTSLLYLL